MRNGQHGIVRLALWLPYSLLPMASPFHRALLEYNTDHGVALHFHEHDESARLEICEMARKSQELEAAS